MIRVKLDLKKKIENILFLTHSYADFQKDQIEIISQHFNHVYALVRYKPIAELSNLISCHSAINHTYKNQFDLTDKPDNITVIPIPLWYLPYDIFYNNLGDYHLRIVEKLIKRRDVQFDIIHAHFIWSSGYVGSKLKKKYGVPFIVTSHGEDVYDYPFRSAYWRKKTFEILDEADEIITVSKNNSKCLHKIVNKKINIISNGFSKRLFHQKSQIECRRKYDLPEKSKIIITIGFMGIVKGQKYLIDAINILKKKYNNILCVIIGEGELYNTLKSQIKDLDLKQNVILTGKIPHHLISDWINASDLFVLPSISEGLPVTQIEAMACGKPVVATRNGGSEEIIKSGNLGYLCEKENSFDLAEKIEKALNKKWNHKKIIKYSKKYTWEKAVHQILNIYKKYLI
jgi:glycosyltransferase involved in cell wall biosynthesis